MFFAVTYDISDSKKDHTEFFEKIKTLGGWMHYIEGTWIVSTDQYDTAEGIFRAIEPFIDKQEDYVFVAEIDSSNTQGWLPKRAWDWFKENG